MLTAKKKFYLVGLTIILVGLFFLSGAWPASAAAEASTDAKTLADKLAAEY